ncbi:MAG: GWxTD domain-containing protein [Bacteroidota bacterium]
MMLLRILFGLLLMLPAFLMGQNWEIAVKSRQTEQGNTLVFLKYNAPSPGQRVFRIDLRFRPKGVYRDFLRHADVLKASGSQMFSLPFTLPPGEYEVDVDIESPELDYFDAVSLKEPYKVNTSLVSDIFLTFTNNAAKAFAAPLVNTLLPPEEPYLHYFLNIGAIGQYELLTVRAFLFREQNPSDKQTPIRAYESIYQKNDVLSIVNENMLVSDQLLLDTLSAGKYLLSIEIYDDAERLGRETVQFTVGGDMVTRIMDDVENSIRMMEYILPEQLLNEMLAYPTEVQLTAFEKAWKDLYGEEYERQMVAYFDKVYEAERRFDEDVPGWQTDRGKVYILYGEPVESTHTINGKEYIRWVYAQWSLPFLFEKRNNRYVRVE